MGLKLLNPSQAAFQTQNRSARDSRRAIEAQELLAKKLKELAQVEKDFDDTLQRNRNQWSAEEQEHANRVAKLKKEVESLEVRKKEALVPLTERQKALDTKANALAEREEEVKHKEHEVKGMQKALETRLDEVSEREERVQERADKLSIREEGVKLQGEQVKKNSELLTQAIGDARAQIAKERTDLEREKLAFQTKESHVAERERLIEVAQKDLERREAKLKDDAELLKRNVERARLKGITL